MREETFGGYTFRCAHNKAYNRIVRGPPVALVSLFDVLINSWETPNSASRWRLEATGSNYGRQSVEPSL
jgi:hypothetical protein